MKRSQRFEKKVFKEISDCSDLDKNHWFMMFLTGDYFFFQAINLLRLSFSHLFHMDMPTFLLSMKTNQIFIRVPT